MPLVVPFPTLPIVENAIAHYIVVVCRGDVDVLGFLGDCKSVLRRQLKIKAEAQLAAFMCGGQKCPARQMVDKAARFRRVEDSGFPARLGVQRRGVGAGRLPASFTRIKRRLVGAFPSDTLPVNQVAASLAQHGGFGSCVWSALALMSASTLLTWGEARGVKLGWI